MHRSARIRAYLEGDLPPAAEARLRRHLRGCARCRATYETEQRLLRALAGDADAPTPAEDARLVDRVLDAAEADEAVAPAAGPARRERFGAGLVDAILWLPGPALAGASLVLVAVVAGAVLALHPGAPLLAAHVVRGEGLLLDAKAQPVGDTPLPLDAGRTLEVGKGGLAVLALERGGELRVYPGTRLSLTARGRAVHLDAGRVWCRIPEGHGRFEVRTGEAVVVDLGTSFVVTQAPKSGTEVRVMSGRVRVSGRGRHARVIVHGGQKTRVAPGHDPTPPARYDPSRDRLDWATLWHRFVQGLRNAIENVRKIFR